MKAAFDSGADASETPAKTAKTPKSTAKTGQTGKTLDSDTAPNSMPSKRKRATAKFSIVKSETGDEEENSDDLPTTPSKKARKMPVKSKVTPKPKVKPEVRDASIEEEVAGDTTPPTSASTTPEVKDEPVENEEVFFDAEDGGAGMFPALHCND